MSRFRELARCLVLPTGPQARRARAIRDGLSLTGLLMAWFVLVDGFGQSKNFAFDANAYWGLDLEHLYDDTISANGFDVFHYSPAFAQLLWPLSMLDFRFFLVLWEALLVVSLVWLAGPWSLAVMTIPFVPGELGYGNIHLLMAAAIVLGFRHPWAWAFVLLTKVTPGIGLLWFALRREWRNLAIAIGGTAAVVAVSAALAPGLWLEWIASLLRTTPATGINLIGIPLPVRLVAAIAIVVWGARTDRPATVPLAAMIALPTIWTHGLSMIVGVVAVERMIRSGRMTGRSILAPPRSSARERGQEAVGASRVGAADATR